MFHLRDALSGSEISGRINDVFSALGSGSVRQPDRSDNKDTDKPNFDRHQLERSKGQTSTANQTNKRGDEEEGGSRGANEGDRSRKGEFKHPAEFLKPSHREEKSGRRTGQEARGGQQSRGGRKGRYVPDHKKNPDKWTKYTLADVDNMTDRSNTAAAMQFLQNIKKNKSEDEPAFDPSQKVVFKKPAKKCATSSLSSEENHRDEMNTTPDDEPMPNDADTNPETGEARPRFVGSKQILPEYNFGAAKRTKKQPTDKARKSGKPGKEMKLSHLDDEEDD